MATYKTHKLAKFIKSKLGYAGRDKTSFWTLLDEALVKSGVDLSEQHGSGKNRRQWAWEKAIEIGGLSVDQVKQTQAKKLTKQISNHVSANKQKTSIQRSAIDVNSKEFLSSFEWRRVRMTALVKYGARCQCCGASPSTGAVMHVDHIKPRRTHPELALDPDNLQILCEECNHGKGSLYDTDWRHQQAEEEIDPAIAAHLREIMFR